LNLSAHKENGSVIFDVKGILPRDIVNSRL